MWWHSTTVLGPHEGPLLQRARPGTAQMPSWTGAARSSRFLVPQKPRPHLLRGLSLSTTQAPRIVLPGRAGRSRWRGHWPRERTRARPPSGPAFLTPRPAWRGVSRTRPLPGAELVASALCLERGWSHLPPLGSLPNSVWWPGLNVSSGWGLSAATVYRGRTHVPVASGELFGGSPRLPGGQVGWRHVGQGRGCVSG